MNRLIDAALAVVDNAFDTKQCGEIVIGQEYFDALCDALEGLCPRRAGQEWKGLTEKEIDRLFGNELAGWLAEATGVDGNWVHPENGPGWYITYDGGASRGIEIATLMNSFVLERANVACGDIYWYDVTRYPAEVWARVGAQCGMDCAEAVGKTVAEALARAVLKFMLSRSDDMRKLRED